MRHFLNYLFTMLIGIAVGIAAYGSYRSHDYHMETEPPAPDRVIEYVYIESEPEIITEYVYIPYEEPFFRNFTEREVWCLKDGAMREGEGESVIGMCWIMYTMICRSEAFGMSIEEVWASSAFESSMSRTGITPNENCDRAFSMIEEGWTPKPLWFRADHYHGFETPLCQVGNHYFSTSIEEE